MDSTASLEDKSERERDERARVEYPRDDATDVKAGREIAHSFNTIVNLSRKTCVMM